MQPNYFCFNIHVSKRHGSCCTAALSRLLCYLKPCKFSNTTNISWVERMPKKEFEQLDHWAAPYCVVLHSETNLLSVHLSPKVNSVITNTSICTSKHTIQVMSMRMRINVYSSAIGQLCMRVVKCMICDRNIKHLYIGSQCPSTVAITHQYNIALSQETTVCTAWWKHIYLNKCSIFQTNAEVVFSLGRGR